MALTVADRIQETTSTTGTGTYTLAGAKSGFQSFAAVGDGNTTYYACTDGTDYEVGIGTYTLSGTTLARTTIIESSNSDAAVNWSAGSKDIFVTLPASKAVVLDASGNATFAGIKATGETVSRAVSGVTAAWVNFNGTGTIAIRDSAGVSSLTDNGTGEYSITYTNAWAAVDYSFTGTCATGTSNSRNIGLSFDDWASTPSTTVHRIVTRRRDANSNRDTAFTMCQVCGDLA